MPPPERTEDRLANRGVPSSEATFRTRLLADRPGDDAAVDRVTRWAKSHGLSRRWTSGTQLDTLVCHLKLGERRHKMLTLETGGLIWVLFGELSSSLPVRDAGQKAEFLAEVRGRMQAIPGAVSDAPGRATQAAWRLEAVDLTAFLATLDWLLENLRKQHEALRAMLKR
jgi:hypothetical protein